MADAVQFTTPVGRLVEGDLYKGSDRDAEGKPLVVKTGTNAGQPRLDFFFALAIPKTAGHTHWAQTDWGKLIWEVGHKAFPNGAAGAPTFAWKVRDGDSTVPNRRGRKPCDREGFPGNWVLSFSSGYAPRIFNANGTEAIQEPGAVKLGYYVQVAGTVAGNGSMQQPGIYLNHSMVALSGYGPEIVVGPDPTSVGFGQAPLPAGVSATPVGALPGAPVTGVAPPPVVATAPARRMLVDAPTYEAFIAAGWTDALLIQHGKMAPPVAPASITPLPGAPVTGVAPPVAPASITPLPGAPVTGVAPPVAPASITPLPGFLTAAPPPVAPASITPHPGFLTAAPPPPVVATAPARRMLVDAPTYEAFIAAGWTDALLIQHGKMAP